MPVKFSSRPPLNIQGHTKMGMYTLDREQAIRDDYSGYNRQSGTICVSLHLYLESTTQQRTIIYDAHNFYIIYLWTDNLHTCLFSSGNSPLLVLTHSLRTIPVFWCIPSLNSRCHVYVPTWKGLQANTHIHTHTHTHTLACM